MIITFSGCDGSGKSTMLNALKESYPATYIKEPYHQEYIDLIASTDDIFKKVEYFSIDRYLLYKDIEFPLESPVISDRSFICSLVYQSLELESKYDWPPFTAIQHIYNQQLVIIPPTIVVYIYAEPSVIYNRLHARGADHHLTMDQIKRIQSRYELIFKLFNLNVLPINTTHTSININVSKILSHITFIYNLNSSNIND